MARALILRRVSLLSPARRGSPQELSDEVASVVPDKLRVNEESEVELDVVVEELLGVLSRLRARVVPESAL